jgi:uncharacterized protein YjdB
MARDGNSNAMSGQSFTWISSEPSIATVGTDGFATAIANGTATINASTDGITGSALLNVAQIVSSVELTPEAVALEPGDTTRITAATSDVNGNSVASATVAWTSSNESVATVDSAGLVIAVDDGPAFVTASSGGAADTALVTVTSGPIVTAVEVSPATVTLTAIGATQDFDAVAKDQGGNAIAGKDFVWFSNDSAVFTVDTAGLVTAVGNGSTTIDATTDGVTGSAVANVTSGQVVTTIEVSPATLTLTAIGATHDFDAVARDEGGSTVVGKDFVWVPNNPAVVTVDTAGLVTAVGNGSTTIDATTDGVTGSADVVVAQAISAVEVSPSAVTVEPGNTTRLAADVSDANDNPVTGAAVSWSSLNEPVATVNDEGLVTGVAEGVALVVASAGGHSDTATVTVASSGSGTILFSEGFEDTDFASRGWYDDTGLSITSAEVHSGTYALEVHFNQGATGPTYGIATRHLFSETGAVYLSYWVKYSSNWAGSGVSFHPHEFHFVTNEDDAWVGLAYTYLTAYVEHNYQQGGIPVLAIQDGKNVDTGNIGVDLTGVTEERAAAGCNGNTDGYPTDCYAAGGGLYLNGKPWLADQPYFVDDAWHFVEAYFALNSIQGGIGATDGVVRYWFDGALVIDHQDVLLRTGVHQSMAFNQLIIAPRIGVGSPVDQTMWVDDLTVATGRP